MTYATAIDKLNRKRRARWAKRDRIRHLEEMGAWAQLIAGFVAALVVLVPVFIMIGTNLSWRTFL